LLYYKKVHPLQEALAFQFDLEVPMANKWIHFLTPILHKSLEKYIPREKTQNIDFQIDEEMLLMEQNARFNEIPMTKKFFIVVKKKAHTMKNALIVSTLGLIMWLGETHVGKVHDKPMAAAAAVESLGFLTPITMLADLGFQGWTPHNVKLILPHKKPRNTKTEKRELTKSQKDFNKELSQKRVKVENVLAHVKILRIVKD
jgi:hypothetical protein